MAVAQSCRAAAHLLLEGLHLGLHLGGRHIAAVHPGTADRRPLRRLRRPVALVRHPHHPALTSMHSISCCINEKTGSDPSDAPLSLAAAFGHDYQRCSDKRVLETQAVGHRAANVRQESITCRRGPGQRALPCRWAAG